MRPQLPSRPLSAAVVIERDGRFAGIRAAKHDGRFELPGGKAQPGEPPAACARRECDEEVGVDPVGPYRLVWRSVVDGYDCHLYAAEIPRDLALRGGPEGPAVWAPRAAVLAGARPAYAAAWLPRYDRLRAREAGFARADGALICWICQRPYGRHLFCPSYVDGYGDPWVRRLCDGTAVVTT